MPPPETSLPPVDPLVDAATLRDLLAAEAVTVLDVRWSLGGPPGAEEYAAGHVPGAAYVDLPTELADPADGGDGGRHPLPGRDRFVGAMQRAGVRRDRPVVAYDDWQGMAAARAWWLLRHHGHEDVRVLDGGWAAWRATGGEEATGPPQPAAVPGDFDGEPGAMPVVGPDRVPDVAVLLDARTAERFRGEREPVDRVAGHVPGARNLPAAALLDEEARFLDPEALAGVLARHGAGPGGDVAAYCGSGITACHTVLAGERGGVRVALYPGSWSGWCSDPSRPVAQGEGT
jgi:thiosulfate/3-mercaptopyruvate sulfurtransferase